MKDHVSLFVFIDALGWEILKEHSFLDDVLVQKSPIDTIFGYSATCDPTILTGKLPREHGHFSFFTYDPENSPFRGNIFLQLMRLAPKSLSSRGRVRNIVSRVLRAQLGYTGYFNFYNMSFRDAKYFDYTEKKDIYQPGGINSGDPTIMDYLRDEKIPFSLSNWRAPETDNLASLSGELEEGKIRFAYLYLAAMDAVLHAEGTHHQKVDEKIAWYDRELRKILEKAYASYKNVHLYIFSDHGMTNVTSVCDLMGRIRSTGLSPMKDYAAVYDSTMARFWFFSDSAEKKIREALKEESQGHILSEKEKYSYGCDFPKGSYGGSYGELFFLLNPGVLLIPSHMGERPIAGMHGYAPEDKDSVASFSSNVKLESKEIPKRLDELYALMKKEADHE
ncbi:MAG: alkaline phosphatase family protein [Spirochaetia bacterium]|nr:alkaline phosphatase family protein [Spirochaetia bacterium]MCF7953216.1 alkaline phosphatase family protein [Spirochaetales bacterium]